MSLVGTRPILPDELEQYELHHRARIGLYYYDGRIWKEVKMEDNTPDKFKTTWGQVLESRDKSSVKRV